MNNVFLYDHVHTPRGKGRPDGALQAIAPVDLAATVLRVLKDRR